MTLGSTPSTAEAALPPAVQAFDRTALQFDARFGGWLSVAAQRRAFRRHLDRWFRPGDTVLELGGGTGEDALYLARRGVRVLLTDGSPAMLSRAAEKVRDAGLEPLVQTRWMLLERTGDLAEAWAAEGRPLFAGAYSNFAALNCIPDPAVVARGLARLVAPGAPALLAVFGPCAAGEILLALARRDPRTAFRRFRRGPVKARLSGAEFAVWYHRPWDLARSWGPYFRLEAVRGLGVFIPPSAAEPGISRWPKVVALLEWLDRLAERPLALLGDHVLLRFRRAGPAAKRR